MRIEPLEGDKAVNERLGDIKRVYSRALAPLTTADPDAFEVILRRHVARAGFRGVQATTKPATLVGFGYGYRSEPGQWWHDTVAPLLVDARLSDWLTDAFELVELHVLPQWQRRGIGRRIHNMLLADVDLPRAVLSVYEDNKRAIGFTRRQAGRPFGPV